MTQAMDDLLEVAKVIIDYIFSNGYLTVMFVASIVGVGCYVVRKVKKTAKH